MPSISKKISQQKVGPTNSKNITVAQQTTEISMWPFPSADEMFKYRSLWDDMVERIVSYGEKEQNHRHDSDKKALSLDEKIVNAEAFWVIVWAISSIVIPILFLASGVILALYSQLYASWALIAASLFSSLAAFWRHWSWKKSQ